MRSYALVIATVLASAGLLSSCSPGSGDAYTLRGTPTVHSGTNSGNFYIGGDQCKYVTMAGFYSDAQVYTFPCKVTKDEADALGDPHTHVSIDITTPKGVKTAQIDGTTAGMTASQAPDLGIQYPFPPSWSVAPPETPITLRNVDIPSMQVVLQASGVECTMVINKAPITCGLAYWSDSAITVWVPGLLVSAPYAQYVIGLNFGKQPTGQWAIARVPDGFPGSYAEVAAAKQ